MNIPKLFSLVLAFTIVQAKAQDTIAPVAMCQDITIYLDSMGNVNLTPVDINNGSSDNEGIDTMYLSEYNFVCGMSPWTSNVTLYVMDDSGNIDSCTANVTVTDTIAPDLSTTCRDTTVYLNQYGYFVNGVDNFLAFHYATDNCYGSFGPPFLTIFQSPLRIPPPIPTIYFDCLDIGQNEITVTANDDFGNIGSCTMTVTVLDTITPTANCRPYIERNLNSDGFADISVSNVSLGTGCAMDSIYISQSHFTCADIGENTVTLTVIDTLGNTSVCTTQVRILNSHSPATGCSDMILYLDSSGADTIIPTDLINGSPCGFSSIEISQGVFTCNDVGPNEVAVILTDTLGNIDTCLSSVTVFDTIAPIMECNDTTLYLNEDGDASLIELFLIPQMHDACGVENIVLSYTPGINGFNSIPPPLPGPEEISFDCDDLGNHLYTYTATDMNGNSASCVSTVTVLDTTPPHLVCHDTTLYLSGNNINGAGAHIWFGYTLIDYSDNCSVTGVDMLGGWGGRSSVPPPPPPDILMWCSDVGELNEILYTASDASGNSSSCISVVTVIDTLRPVFTSVPADVTVCSGIANGANVYFGPPIAVDVCGIDTMWQSAGLPSGSLFPLGLTTNTFTAIDVNGNTRSASFTVTVLSEDPPAADFSYSSNYCADSEFEFNSIVTDTNYSYSWHFGDGNQATGADTLHTYSSSGSFDVTLSVTNNFGCVVSSTQTLSLMPQPGLSVTSEDVNCYAGNDGWISATATGTAPFSFSLNGNPLTGNGTFTNLPADTHHITVMDANGCANDTTFIIEAPEEIEVLLWTMLPVDCHDNPIGVLEFIASGGTAPYLYSLNGTQTNLTGSFHYLTMGEYILTVTDVNGCAYQDTFELVANTPLPVANFTYSLNGPNVSFDNTSNAYASATNHWDFGDGNTSILGEPNHTYADNGAYYVTLIITTHCGADTVGYWIQVTGVGVNDIGDDTLIDLSPNPNNGSFTLQLESTAAFNELSIRIWSIEGKLIDSKQLNASGKTYKGNFNYQLASGVYTLELIIDETSHHKRLVVR